MTVVTNEELEIVLRSCLDEIHRIQIKRRNFRVLSYSDLQLEMNATKTALMIQEVLDNRRSK